MMNAHGAVLIGVLLLAGCNRSGNESRDANTGKPLAAAGADTGMTRMSRMDSGDMGMSAAHDSGRGMGMMPMMRAHMDSMQRMSPAQMEAMMAMHQDMMARMMDNMGGDMRGMHTEADGAWNALSDSVRQDLADLPALTGKALETRMRAHVGRVRRLLAQHEKMMGK